MKKLSLPINVISVFLCGLVVQMSYDASGHAAWSLLISAVRQSPWETVKPFGLVFIMWSFIELSWLRPHLLRFVCARMTALLFFVPAACILLCTAPALCRDEWFRSGVILLCISAAEILQTVIYRSGRRIELFFIPLLAAFAVIFFSFLFCTFYPPDMLFFAS